MDVFNHNRSFYEQDLCLYLEAWNTSQLYGHYARSIQKLTIFDMIQFCDFILICYCLDCLTHTLALIH